MSPEWIHFIQQYGVLGIIVGALVFEDVTLLLAVSFLHTGVMSFQEVFWGSFVGLNLGNWLCYAMGYAASFPSFPWQNWAERLKITAKNLGRANDVMIFVCRFVPGTRVPVYAMAGFTRYSLPKFFIFNFVSAAIWSLLVLYLGESLFQQLKSHWWLVLLVVLLLFIGMKLGRKQFFAKKQMGPPP